MATPGHGGRVGAGVDWSPSPHHRRSTDARLLSTLPPSLSIPVTPGEAVMTHHVPTHKRSSLDADGRPQVSAMMALLAAAAIVLLILATSAVSDRLVG